MLNCQFLLLLLFPVAVITDSTTATFQRLHNSKPNFILIFIDDTGYGDYSFNDHNRTDTPHLQALAEQGLTFDDFHSGASVCTPSRAALLTGRLGLRTGVKSNFGPFSRYGLPLNETTIAELLKKVGYKTAAAGKWHLGHRSPHSPIHRGFDTFLGLPMSHDYGCTDHAGYDISCKHRFQDVCHPKNIDLADPSVCHIGPNNPWNESIPLYRDDTIVEQPVDLTTLSDRYVTFAIDFIQNVTSLSQDEAPFFVYLPFNHMHVPIGNHRPSFTNTSIDRGVYGDTLRQLDASIGALMQALIDLQVENNTLIIVTGDNGAPSDQCEYGGLNSPFTGDWLSNTYKNGGGTGKTTTWEGGHREPGLAVWPMHIRAGSRSSVTVSALDILPTFAALAGVEVPAHRHFDGIDISSVLFDQATETSRTALFHPNSGCEGIIGEIETVRIQNFKAKWRTGASSTGNHCNSCSGGVAPDVYHNPPLLFDLDVDKQESMPLPSTDSRYASVLQSMRNALNNIYVDIKNDNTTVANYASDISMKPCCNASHRFCMCEE